MPKTNPKTCKSIVLKTHTVSTQERLESDFCSAAVVLHTVTWVFHFSIISRGCVMA